jgi:hypothetical protein
MPKANSELGELRIFASATEARMYLAQQMAANRNPSGRVDEAVSS